MNHIKRDLKLFLSPLHAQGKYPLGFPLIMVNILIVLKGSSIFINYIYICVCVCVCVCVLRAMKLNWHLPIQKVQLELDEISSHPH